MSLIVKGFGTRGATILVKGFGSSVFRSTFKKILYVYSSVMKVLNVESRKF